MTVTHLTRIYGHVTIHTDDGTYMVQTHGPEDLHRLAADEDHKAAICTHRANVYRAAADMWEREEAAKAAAEAAKPARGRAVKPAWAS